LAAAVNAISFEKSPLPIEELRDALLLSFCSAFNASAGACFVFCSTLPFGNLPTLYLRS
jgi:hypothetical protein